jgi:hypothetical protein
MRRISHSLPDSFWVVLAATAALPPAALGAAGDGAGERASAWWGALVGAIYVGAVVYLLVSLLITVLDLITRDERSLVRSLLAGIRSHASWICAAIASFFGAVAGAVLTGLGAVGR